ncbi:hypothetical protein Poli38472_004729 [Pythium oligandrum]|uniref:RRP15-like protein n=1 Tax=Pythium oligandrum TaxID=41045 RepID=A0A8K1CBA8_PYTOL|nr:hypothetical protein Poli38472_004729 [Pythium oligandrum]|eukprot:TMW59660.1 hypothetical protein Poli38472_004729 [Pythium oligandrum]
MVVAARTKQAAAGGKASKKVVEAVDEPMHSSGDDQMSDEATEDDDLEADKEMAEDDDANDGEESAGDEEEDGGDVDDDLPLDNDDDEEIEAVGFGDAMSKILQQNVGDDAQPILAKRTTARMREIMNEKKEVKKDRVSAAEKRAKERKDNVIPSHVTAVKDRQLRKIATKGVVALFNAIAKHQHQTGKTTEKEDKKVKELSKENFLGLLKASSQKTAASDSSKPAPAAKSSWSVLQDDYMMSAKLKDWDNTHKNESERPRRREGAKGNDDDSDPEAAEEKAWKQVGTMDSDDEQSASTKRKSSTAKAGKGDQKKRAKRS